MPEKLISARVLMIAAAALGLLAVTAQSGAAQNEAAHSDPFSNILLEMGLLILAAMVGRWLAERTQQPAVLGELLIGVLVGNLLYWFGHPVAVLIMHMDIAAPLLQAVWESGVSVQEAARQLLPERTLAPGQPGELVLRVLSGAEASRNILMGFSLWLFSNLGVILLLFMVGLESRVEEMRRVGWAAFLVAVVGVVAPFALGYLVSSLLLPKISTAAHLFIGATLSATSVGITARVFKDLERIQTPEAKLILGAAVIDDVLGLIILAVVVGIVTTGSLQWAEVAKITALSVAFFALLIFFGGRYMHRLTTVVSRFERRHLTLLFPLVVAFIVAWGASQIGLAAIVGAFAAGLIINDEHFAAEPNPRQRPIEILSPLEALFAPVFFLLMGMQVNLSTFLKVETLVLASALTAVAVIGKIVSGIAASRGMDRLSVGIGMIPRGEVGLIFASIGKGVGVVSDAVFSAVVLMVIVTTLITPVGLSWSLARKRGEPSAG